MTSPRIALLNAGNWLGTLTKASRPRIFVNSIPKTGTNLVVSLARAYGRLAISGPLIAREAKPGDFRGRKGLVFGHVEKLPAGFRDAGFDDAFLLVRRPEDYVLSLARYIQANSRHPAHRELGQADGDTLVAAVIEGIQRGGFVLKPIDVRYREYLEDAARHGLKPVDFDQLKASPVEDGAAAELLRCIGGEDFAQSHARMLEKSRDLSSTYRHSSRSTLNVGLSDNMRAHPAFQTASELYDLHLPR